jgi:hypothetical protein
MRSSLGICGLAVGVCSAVLAFPASTSAESSAATLVCKVGYAYTGAEDSSTRAGIRAGLGTVSAPRVMSGHVGGWVGVGGPNAGPGGTAEWLQAGYSGFDTRQAEIYYEVATPGKPPAYHTIEAGLRPTEHHLVSVLENRGRVGTWRIWVDDEPVSPTFVLTGSHGRFVPQAIGEDWSGSRRCNHFEYSFTHIQVAAAPGGFWTAPRRGYTFRSIGYRATKTGPASFVARSVAAAATAEPPLLGAIARKLSGRRLTASCARQSAATRESPAGRLLIAAILCETLVGYAVAEPWVPRARSGPGFAVAKNGLLFLRGVARSGHVAPANLDCRAVGWFYRLFRRLGATPGQALALRGQLLRRRGSIVPSLALSQSCPIR